MSKTVQTNLCTETWQLQSAEQKTTFSHSKVGRFFGGSITASSSLTPVGGALLHGKCIFASSSPLPISGQWIWSNLTSIGIKSVMSNHAASQGAERTSIGLDWGPTWLTRSSETSTHPLFIQIHLATTVTKQHDHHQKTSTLIGAKAHGAPPTAKHNRVAEDPWHAWLATTQHLTYQMADNWDMRAVEFQSCWQSTWLGWHQRSG